eukprot:CAMPEP_0172558018 /NCGR_PEP_ID=MMETSP1067-20121228/76701_1 /TAXON_ID=265564 ORGANISM="Thalassiosira punctigera, Strain Tpunct2005C2" /NCGR_SAMPLE_ID=MMETSP1067 /ASSEMBLY_ACC=CAM_ASM_000444 /LENGTH=65 /DNA_ID=CAMNT_0013347261 /DNA_START=29 /DNA_END=226 /DNA_ORIENTATION=+
MRYMSNQHATFGHSRNRASSMRKVDLQRERQKSCAAADALPPAGATGRIDARNLRETDAIRTAWP